MVDDISTSTHHYVHKNLHLATTTSLMLLARHPDLMLEFQEPPVETAIMRMSAPSL